MITETNLKEAEKVLETVLTISDGMKDIDQIKKNLNKLEKNLYRYEKIAKSLIQSKSLSNVKKE